MDAEAPAVAHLFGGVGEHGVARRVADGFADPLQDDQQRGYLPAAGQREQRHHRHLQDVAADRDRPVPTGAVGAAPGDQPQAVAEQFAEPGDHAIASAPAPSSPRYGPMMLRAPS